MDHQKNQNAYCITNVFTICIQDFMIQSGVATIRCGSEEENGTIVCRAL